ncbi:MAG: FecR domain-containing protein [Acidobacteria bacterium]|nr:FecR domain-containing protein [Acidobacteriota bacterium]MBK8150539.1 FecR domain-containing protein [Acidobacteriota bacterium]MBK8810918.1 FecR domain-containing protein [Acidobacteriota bacterium]
MLSKNLVIKSVTLLTAVAFWCVSSMVVLAAPKDFNGEITVSGDVSVNGQKVVSGSTVVSGSIITTGDGGSATVSLGKTGRIELSSKSSLTLRFSESGITGILNEGKVRVANSAGIAASITTRNAAVIADSGQANNFEVEVECSHTHVDTFSGLVTLRGGSNDRQVAAGTDAVEGNLSQQGCQPCVRPGPGVPTASIGALPLIAILLAAAGGVGTAIILGGGSDTTTGGGTTVVSTVR